MSMSNFNLRNLTPEVMLRLKKEAANQKISVNSLILQIIDRGLGFAYPTKKTVFHDLDHLAGTWSREDLEAFEENVTFFEQIDEEMWS